MEFLIFMVLVLGFFIAMCILTEEKIDINFKAIILYIFGVIIITINYKLSPDFLRIIINIFMLFIIAVILFKKNLKESIILSISCFILTICAETIYSIIYYPIYMVAEISSENILSMFFNNFIISLLLVILSKTKFIKQIYYSLNNETKKINDKQAVFFSLFIIVFFNLVSLIFYFGFEDSKFVQYSVLVSSILMIVNCVIVYNYLRSKNNYLKVNDKYSISLKNIREYEIILDKYKINNHENKNQLLVIRNMCTNKKVINYIDSLIDNNIKDDEQLLMEVSRIPAGGLRGLVYTKLLLMKKKNIQFELNIDKKMSISKFSKIEDSFIIDICKIIGVFIDNAIEAVENLNEKYIEIELYMEKLEAVISISNNYIGHLNIEEIGNIGYSTKEKGRGYGLTLVNDIILKNNKLINTKEIYEDNFTQTLRIKL